MFSSYETSKELRKLERMDTKRNLMDVIKHETRMAVSNLNKLILKNDTFKTIHNLVCNNIRVK